MRFGPLTFYNKIKNFRSNLSFWHQIKQFYLYKKYCFFSFVEAIGDTTSYIEYIPRKYYWCPKKLWINYGTIQLFIFLQYCNSNVRLFSFSPHLVIALPTLWKQKLSLWISLLHFLSVLHITGSWLHLCSSPHVFSYRPFALFSLSHLRARKIINYRYWDSWNRSNF